MPNPARENNIRNVPHTTPILEEHYPSFPRSPDQPEFRERGKPTHLWITSQVIPPNEESRNESTYEGASHYNCDEIVIVNKLNENNIER
jgi:hypothetical protein